MRVLVCGGRIGCNEQDVHHVMDFIAHVWEFPAGDATEVTHGDADGVDRAAGKWAHDNGYRVHRVPINGLLDGPFEDAGKRRNVRMKEQAKPRIVVCFPGHPGTRHMMDTALADPDCVVLDVDLNRDGQCEIWQFGTTQLGKSRRAVLAARLNIRGWESLPKMDSA